MLLPPGTRLGASRSPARLAPAGWAKLYRAEDARLGRAGAIKVLPPHVATPDRVDRFRQEARAASTLNHPNILTIYDVGRDGDTAWFAMELVEGQTLRDLLNAGPIPLKRGLDFARQVAEGLAKAHAAGVVHRDLKPENVMVTGDGLTRSSTSGLPRPGPTPRALLLARSSTRTAMAGTTPGVVVGTVGYMSPEQATGRPVDYRADQFALGLLIYELVTRTRPFARSTTAQSIAAPRRQGNTGPVGWSAGRIDRLGRAC